MSGNQLLARQQADAIQRPRSDSVASACTKGPEPEELYGLRRSAEGRHQRVDPDSLPGQVARGRGAQEECQRSGVVELRVVRHRTAVLVLNARGTGAEQDRVDADAVRAELDR